MDAFNSLHSVTFEMDEKHGTAYHAALQRVRRQMQRNLVIGGAMTDPKGDRSKGPPEQADPDLFVRVVSGSADGVVIHGAKAHQTGCINSHWIIVMPTMRLGPADRDYAIIGAIPVDDRGSPTSTGGSPATRAALEGGTSTPATRSSPARRR